MTQRLYLSQYIVLLWHAFAVRNMCFSLVRNDLYRFTLAEVDLHSIINSKWFLSNTDHDISILISTVR